MSNTLLLGVLLTQLRADASGMQKGSKEATDALRKVQAESQKTREVLKKAFAVDAIVGSIRSVTAELAKSQSTGVQAFAAIGSAGASMAQGWAQGGPLGLIIGGLGAIASEGVKAWNAVEDAAREAFEAAAEGHAAEAVAISRMRAELAGAEASLAAIGSAMASGKALEETKMLEAIERTGKEYRDAKAALSIFDAQAAYVKKGLPDAHDPTRRAADKRAEIAAQLTAIEGRRTVAQEGVTKLGGASDAAVLAKSTAKAMAALEKQEKWLADETQYRKDAAQAARTFAYQNELQAREAKRQSAIDTFARVNKNPWASAQDAEDRGARMSREQAQRFGGDHASARATELELSAASAARIVEAFAAAAGEGGEGGFVREGGMRSGAYEGLTNGDDGSGSYEGFTNGMDDAAAGVETRIGDAAGRLTGAFEGPIRALASGDLIGGLIGFVMQSKAAAKLMEVAEPILQSFADNLGMMLAPFIPMVERIGKFLIPVFEAVGDFVFDVLAPAVGAHLAVFAGLEWILVEFGNAGVKFGIWVLEAIDLIPGIDMSAEIAAQKAKLVEQKGFVETVTGAYNEVVNYDIDKLRGLGDAADKVSESMLNLPAGFKLQAARFDAADVDARDRGPGSGPAGPARGGSGGGQTTNIYGPINVAANTVDDIVRSLEGDRSLDNASRYGGDADDSHPYAANTYAF